MGHVADRMRLAADRAGAPLTCMIELTRRCNLSCDHCYVDHHIKDQLSLEELSVLFADLAAEGCLFLHLTGGEVGLRHDFVEIVREARKHRFNLKINSTGTLWSDKDIAALADMQVRHVNVSVYSDSPLVHDKVVNQKGAFEKTMRAIRALRAHNINVTMQCPLMSSTREEIPKIIALADSLGCHTSFDPVVTPMEDGSTDPCSLRLTAGQIAAVYGQGGVVEFMGGDDSGLELLPKREPGDAMCSAGRTLAFVDSKGGVYPCVNWRESFGSLRHQRFADIWRNSPSAAQARELTAEKLGECQGCGNEQYCNYCPGLSHAERGAAHLASPSACNAAEAKRLHLDVGAKGLPITDPGFVGVGRFTDGRQAPTLRGRRGLQILRT